jgi:hypothetical protein
MAQRAGNDRVTTTRAALRMDQVPTRSVAPRNPRPLCAPAMRAGYARRLCAPAMRAGYAATTTRDSADANASESTRPS